MLLLLLTLVVILALSGVLMNRLGAFRRLQERRDDEAFEASVGELGEDVAWKDHMHRMERRLPAIHKMPSIGFKMGRER